jgi:tetratricopeptide (TPR) repeat protein
MGPSRYIITATAFLLFCLLTAPAFSQLGVPFSITKPKEYEERTLRSERSDQKKFTVPRRFIQNTFTHYNYFFNANQKLNEVIDKAKASFTDDYSQLLPFYNYSLDVTAADSLQLDSINSKSQTGIALHDLRNDWVDNLYILWGASYYFRKQFDSAYLMFQYINYAFAEKEKDGYYKTIGSNRDGNNAYSISTKEKNSLPRRMFSEPPSRNDAFIWQIRNFLAQDQFPEAASLIVTLRADPVFPKRLHNDLEEVQAYWFYKQNMWDSAANHLEKALGNASNKQERARWEYLLAQLHELSGSFKEAEKFYAKAIGHTTDPILDIYARLYSIRVNKDGGENYIDKNIAELLKMARRDKYEEFRDIIYYMAAQMQLERGNVDGALPLLLKSTQYSNNNPTNRNKAFLQLAELSFQKRLYRQAYNFYDSVQMDDPSLKDPNAIQVRKEALGRIAMSLEIVERQDSLQRIAGMPEDERRDYVKKLVRDIRKKQGLKAEDFSTGSSFTNNNLPPSFFPGNEPKAGDFFTNPTSRTKGANDFKAKWGNRPNVDNWRRGNNIAAAMQDKINKANQASANPNATLKGGQNTGGELTFDGLYGNLPLTPEQLKASNDSIQNAMFKLGKAYIQDIEDCSIGTETFENLRTRYPGFNPMDEVLFNLYYCYNKNGETAKAAAIKQLMSQKYDTSNFTTIVVTGKNPQSAGNTDATKAYEKIYDLFIEGNFAEAIAQKKIADSMYSKSNWTPQLLYIESVYYIKQRDDSAAIKVLNNIVSQFPESPLAPRATNMINVLGRRKEIEDELTKLNITRPVEDTTRRSTATNIPVPTRQLGRDTAANQNTVPTPGITNNRPQVDTAAKQSIVKQPVATPFAYAPGDAHYVVLILTKVDQVFASEAKNAFYRYNRETFYNKQFALDLVEIDGDNRFMLISPFKTAEEALAYVDKTRPRAATDIIPWLKGGKYTFSIINEKNLQLLQSNKNVENYKAFLNQHLPGRF